MTTDLSLLTMALDALEIGYAAAKVEADRYREAMAGYRPQQHEQIDADVQRIAAAITALKAALAEPAEQSHKTPSCDECGKRKSDGWALYCVSCVEKAFTVKPTQSTHSADCRRSR